MEQYKSKKPTIKPDMSWGKNPLSLDDLQGLFYLTAILMFLSLIAFIFEKSNIGVKIGKKKKILRSFF